MTIMAVKVEINRLFWFNLTRELYRRGRNKRESGAFLLGREDSPRIVRAVYYDDLDPNCLNRGYINFDGAGYVPLWKICQDENLRVIADVHTHPTTWTDQSESDTTNPMVAQKGHMALIIPNYARRLRFSLRGVGIFEYLGDGQWQQWPSRSGIVFLTCL
jgi:proteasome lid subunit RPN8/RPN11